MSAAVMMFARPRADGRPRLRGLVHAAAVPVAVVAGLLLWGSADGSLPLRLSVLVFVCTLVGLYTVSSAYHVGRWDNRVRGLLARIDGAMIQLFIAGSFTPVAFAALDGSWRQWSLVAAWTVAGVGAAVVVSPLTAPRWLGTAGYIAVGWLAVVPMTRIALALPWQGVGLIVLGGVLYTLGALVYAVRRPDPLPSFFGFHEIFHLLVVAASAAHYVAIWRFVLPYG